MTVKAKICGITTGPAIEAAVAGGAAFIGLVFFQPSPRNLRPAAAAKLIEYLPEDVTRVGLMVDPDDRLVDAVLRDVRLDMLQLHGHETPERVEALRLEYGLPVMKALPIAGPEDVEAARIYADVADWLLFDAKPPKDASRPGGNAQAFEWSLLAGTTWPIPWMLAGGLTPENVAQAVAASGAGAVDVSSGVEDAPGIKSPRLIHAFLETVAKLA
ncbi:MAG: phosphoribosylanthranilate isomerase [Alphaproteobacteria bacterium]|nr:phosphoribosylanthranilate isomerase [Alphaproteobacteria bacterium]